MALPSLGQIRRFTIRQQSFACTSRKWMVCDSVAENTFTGTATRPNEIVPFQIERGAMPESYPLAMRR